LLQQQRDATAATCTRHLLPKLLMVWHKGSARCKS
jgi:hypothetical protein